MAVGSLGLLLLVAVGCGDGAGNAAVARPDLAGTQITLGSGDAGQSVVVAELYGQALEAHGATVVRQLGLGGREGYFPLLEQGQISLVPETTNELLTYLAAPGRPSAVTTSEQIAAITAALPTTLTVLSPSSAEDKETIACRRAIVEDHDLLTRSDLERSRADVSIGVVEALERGEVDCASVRSASSLISRLDLVTLDDDLLLVPNETVVPLVATTSATPSVQAVLDAVSSTLHTSDLVALMAAIDDEGVEPAEAAADWLEAHGLT